MLQRDICICRYIFSFFFFLFFISEQLRWEENRARARILHLSFLWRRIKRNSRKYKFIIVRAEPFFPPHMRGKHFSAISTSSHARGVKELPVTAKLSLLLLIQWFESAHATKDLRKFYQFFWIIQHAKTTFEKNRKPGLFYYWSNWWFAIKYLFLRDIPEMFQREKRCWASIIH